MANPTDVRNLYLKFGLVVNDKPTELDFDSLVERRKMMSEELSEFNEAVWKEDFAGQADALIDLVYFALGTANAMGLPWQELWDDVHRANTTKIVGETKRGMKADITKPEGWEGPKTLEILKKHGYKDKKDDDNK